jgi:hypothetical protein
MTLPSDIARCDGLLPKLTKNEHGKTMVLWSLDCPQRETCARFLQMQRDMEAARESWFLMNSHYHAPGEACGDYLEEREA